MLSPTVAAGQKRNTRRRDKKKGRKRKIENDRKKEMEEEEEVMKNQSRGDFREKERERKKRRGATLLACVPHGLRFLSDPPTRTERCPLFLFLSIVLRQNKEKKSFPLLFR